MIIIITILCNLDMSLFEKKNKADYIVSFQANSIKTKQTKSDWKLIGSLCF